MRKITVLLAFLAAVLAAYAFLGAPRVCFGLECVPVELAIAQAEQEKGLMYRASLDGGMLFMFPKEEKYGFWMRNMGFPIDIIWISADKHVVDISGNVPPCTDSCPVYHPGSAVRYVLEVPANYSMEKGIRPGEAVVFLGVGR